MKFTKPNKEITTKNFPRNKISLLQSADWILFFGVNNAFISNLINL